MAAFSKPLQLCVSIDFKAGPKPAEGMAQSKADI
ncbi:hypothetical protein EV128_1041, partial [Rhizobium azibense]